MRERKSHDFTDEGKSMGSREEKTKEFNNIGIDSKLDWDRIKKLLTIGLMASCLVFVGDMLLGYGTSDKGLSGIERMLSSYVKLSDTRIFWSSILGILGIPLEGLCYFGIYRLMAETAPGHAHIYRSGIFGYLIFGGCGVHMPCLAAVYFYKYMLAADPDTALKASVRFGEFFLLPGMILFFIFFCILSFSQISAFAKKMTPYPRWCWIFSLPVGMVITLPLNMTGDSAMANGVSAAWISIGNIWMFGGLLFMMKRVRRKVR